MRAETGKGPEGFEPYLPINYLRRVVFAYGVVVLVLACWAWYIDITHLHDTRDTMLPDFLLAGFTMPFSLTLSLVYEAFPRLFASQLSQVALITLSGAAQVGFFWWLSSPRLLGRPSAMLPPNPSFKRTRQKRRAA